MAAERIELVKHCSSKEWSKAIRVLDSLLSQSCVIQDIWKQASIGVNIVIRVDVMCFTVKLFYLDLANSEKALECLQHLLQIDGRFTKAYHRRGLLLHGMGEHKNAIKDLSIGLSLESSNIECLYLRASCYHAIGEYREAKEVALYTASKLNTEFCWFDIGGDIDTLFKEYWCKRLQPKNVCEKFYRQPPQRDSLRKAKLRKQEFSLTKQKIVLLESADSIGKKLQYHCPGNLATFHVSDSPLGFLFVFLLHASNGYLEFQHRMAGLAAIEIAQKVSKAWRSLQAEWKHSSKGAAKSGWKVRRKEKLIPPSQNRGGAGCSTSSLSEMSTSCGLLEDIIYALDNVMA
ncbi:hypothetical protein ACH5RR_011508 [Cinchona calisaya]|uniref:Uncharacterized protein n=1 Tax=Cinchona calisaya TaxID=153742 RepID=A0ABD3A7N3_9GENT